MRLRCEYQDDPLGIDATRPRLSWWSGDDRPAERQTSYRLLAASHPDLLAMDEGDLWDSGQVEGRETVQVEYQGKPLTSGRSVWWKVRCFDSDGLPSPWSLPARFEVGLLAPQDWSGHWICAGQVGSRITPVPVPLFGRTFDLEQAVSRARLYLAVRGQIAIQLNGKALGADCLAPGWVDYARRAEYQSLDLTDQLRRGQNRLAVLLADGWYAGDPGTGRRQQYGDRPEFIIELKLTLEDGSSCILATDGSWRWQPSWILSAEPSTGEAMDGMRRRLDWLGDGPDSPGWYPVIEGLRPEAEDVVLSAACPGPVPVRDGPGLEAELVRWRPERCAALFEVPGPVLGRARLELTAPDGGAFRVRYALAVDDQGEPVVSGEDVYVARGDEQGETFEGQFSLHGFRYVEVSGDLFREDTVRVFALPIARRLAGSAMLVTDHPRLNQLYDLLTGHLQRVQHVVSMAGLRPADRIGRLSESGSSAASLLLALDSAAAVSGWLQNMVDAQFPDGGLPAVVPAPPAEDSLCSEGPAGSSAAFVEALWQLYRHTGDRRLLSGYYPAAKRLLAGALDAAKDFIRADLDGLPGYPADLLATAWLYRTARMTSRIAGVLGNLSDLENCEELAGNVRNAFRRRFVTTDGRVIGDGAAVCAMTLSFGLLDRTEQRRARLVLIESVESAFHDGAASATERRALLATPFLLQCLSECGRLDLAYRLVLETPVVPEAALGGSDLNRLVGAGVLEWLLATLSGFGLSRELSEQHNAYRHMIVQPRPPLGLGIGELHGEPPVRAVEAELTTVNGRYESSWRLTEEAFEIRVRVPGNCSAEVILPDGSSRMIDAGVHDLHMPFGEVGDGIPILREVS